MTSPLRIVTILLPVAVMGSAFWAVAPAVAQNDSRAVAQCRAEMLRQFPDGAVRSHRIGAITGNSRRVRVTMFATADRRYSFDCVTDAEGSIQTAALNPPANTRLAGSGATAQGEQR